MGAVILPFINLDQYLPGQSKWVKGGVWFVIGAVLVAYGLRGAKGMWSTVVMGAGTAFFVGAFLIWGGWSYAT